MELYENPYRTPQTDRDTTVLPAGMDARTVVQGPAAALMAASAIWSIPLIFGIFVDTIYLLVSLVEPTAQIDLVMTARVLCLGLMTIINLIVFWGAVKMRELKSYRSAHLSAVLALIPFCGLLFLFSIPLGLWALMVLNRPGIRSAFQS